MKKFYLIICFLSILIIGIKIEEKIPEKYINSINYLIEKDIIKGFPDGTLKVNWAITQSEFITLITRCNLKYKKDFIKKDFFIIIRNLYQKIKAIFKKESAIKFSEFKDKWFHPYLIEYQNITGVDKKNIEPLSYINIYEALYFILMASPFKGEIEYIVFPIDNDEKASILISAISHKYFLEGLSFKDRLSRGDAFLLIENYLRKVEDAISN
jgi:hypothetical protein